MSGSFEIYDKNTIVIDDITNDIFTEIIKYNKISINQYTKEYYTLYPIRDRDDLSDKNKIKLCGGFNRCIDALSNFDNITHIILHLTYNIPITKLPKKLTHLILSEYFGKYAYDHIGYNYPLPELPETLTHLILNNKYNFPFTKLPKNLTHLILGTEYKHPLPELPETLKYLSVNYRDILSKNILLPVNLEHLICYDYMSTPINLPENIKSLMLNISYKINQLPKNLVFLDLEYNYQQLPELPETLKYLNLNCKSQSLSYINKTIFTLPILPASLTHLKIELCSYLILEKIYNLPPYLTHLSINCYYSYSLDDLPQGLLYLYLQDYEGEINDLPNTLKELYIYSYCHHYKINMLPESIEILDIPHYMARIEKLPSKLKKLRVHNQSQHLLDYEKFNDLGIEVIYQKP